MITGKSIAGKVGAALGFALMAAAALFVFWALASGYMERNPNRTDYVGVWQAYEVKVDDEKIAFDTSDGSYDYVILRADGKAKLSFDVVGIQAAYEGSWERTERDRREGTDAGVVVYWDDSDGSYANPYEFAYLGDETPATFVDQPLANGILSIDYGYRKVYYERILDNVPDKYWNLGNNVAVERKGNVPDTTQESLIPSGAISWQKAQSHIGENVIVYGPVANTNYAAEVNGRPTYLDIGVAYPDKSGVSVVIWGEDRATFDGAPESTYQGKTICVTGEPYTYNEQCYIKVTSPSQIQVL